MSNVLTIDKEKAIIYAQELTVLFQEITAGELLTVACAYTMALANLTNQVKENTTCEEEDATEKLILTWLSNMDKKSNLNFSKYISI